MTCIRLAMAALDQKYMERCGRATRGDDLEKQETAPAVRLVAGVGGGITPALARATGGGNGLLPALLVSYAYLDNWEKHRSLFSMRDWALDSGAFTAHASGKPVNRDAFHAKAQQLLADDPLLVEVFALDVIDDWKASLRNCEAAWEAGIPAIPTYHVGEPEDYLLSIARDYPKIALGGAVGLKTKAKIAWAQQCFARVWPKRIHGLGFGSRESMMAVPFHSTDASNWEMATCKYGTWKAFGGERVSVRGSDQELRVELEFYLKLEREVQHRWKKQMAELEQLPTTRGVQ